MTLPLYTQTLGNKSKNKYRNLDEKMRKILTVIKLPRVKMNEQPIISYIPPWNDLYDRILTDLPISSQMSTASNSIFDEYLKENYPDYYVMYTDGSKLDDGSTSAAYYNQDNKRVETYKLNPIHTIVGAELFAIGKALESVEKKPPDTKVVIFTDSQSALAIHNQKHHNSNI